MKTSVYLGTDGGATTSKVGGVWDDGTVVSTRLLQRPTNCEQGRRPSSGAGSTAVADYLAENGLDWDQVGRRRARDPRARPALRRLGQLAEPAGEFRRVRRPHRLRAGPRRAGRPAVPLVVGNDGNMGGVAEAQRVRGSGRGTVLMLAPGSGLGCAFVDGRGLPLDGDTLAGMEAGHMPAPLHLLGAKPYPCGCGRTWGCVEVYTTLSGLPYLLAERLAAHPDHALAHLRRATRNSARSRSAAWPRRATRWRSRSSTSRPARWACTWPAWRWRSTRSSSSSAAA